MKRVFRRIVVRKILRPVIGGLIVFGLFLFAFSFFRIKHVEVEPSHVSVVIDSSQVPFHLLLFPGEKLRTALLSEYPGLQDVQFIKKYPDTLKIHLLMREPVAYIMSGERMLAVDEDGILFEYSQTYTLPILELSVDEMIPGKKARGNGVNTSLSFVNALRNHEAIERIVLRTTSTLEARIKDATVLLSVNSDGSAQADTLQALLKGFRMKGSVPQVIDLRFSKPIIYGT
jgi:hypothetical protein